MLWELSVAEQRYRAVLEVGVGVPAAEVVERYGSAAKAYIRWWCATVERDRAKMPSHAGGSGGSRSFGATGWAARAFAPGYAATAIWPTASGRRHLQIPPS